MFTGGTGLLTHGHRRKARGEGHSWPTHLAVGLVPRVIRMCPLPETGDGLNLDAMSLRLHYPCLVFGSFRKLEGLIEVVLKEKPEGHHPFLRFFLGGHICS